MPWFDGFESGLSPAGDVELFVRTGGNAARPPLLLLHGFPQTHAMWHRAAIKLAPHFRLVIPDLRGYGDSMKPVGAEGDASHALYSKRAMAADMAELMASLGHRRFLVCGHDRGGRVAHRLALDYPERVEKLALIDIAPTLDMYDRTDMRFAQAYWHWFFLIQPQPLPERMIGGDPVFWLRWTLGGWGTRMEPSRSLHSLPPEGAPDALGTARRPSALDWIEPEAMAEYERAFSRADTIHAACEDYRASASIDLEHDRASRAEGEKIACDLHLIWGSRGIVGRLYDMPALWREQCSGSVSGSAVDAGHFIPEELPDETASRLLGFFGGAA